MEPVPVKHQLQQDAGSEYSADETDFLRAIQQFQKKHGKRVLSFVEVLRVAESLGYRSVQE